MSDSDLEREFYTRWIQLAPDLPEPVTEYRFCPGRKWRFDFSWPEQLVAVEMEGGTYTRGRHVRPSGFEGDCRKYNAAVVRGWMVLRFTGGMIRTDPNKCIQAVRLCLVQRL